MLKFEKNILLLLTSVIFIFKGKVKNYTRWEWKPKNEQPLASLLLSNPHATIIRHLPHEILYD